MGDSSDNVESSGKRQRRSGAGDGSASRLSTDGGTVDWNESTAVTAARSGYERAQTWNRRFRERAERSDSFGLLVGCLFALGVLGIGAGLAGFVPPAVLGSLGLGLVFVAYLLLAVVLLRAPTEDDESSTYSWARRQRPPVKRRR